MKDFVFDKLICDKYFPTEEDNAENEEYWDDIFEKDLVWCEDFYNWSGREYSAKDICVMIQFLHHGEYLDTFILGDIDPEYLVGHTINNILRYEINEEFEEWCKEKLGTDPDDNSTLLGYSPIPFISNKDLVSRSNKVYQVINKKIKVNEDGEPISVGIIVDRKGKKCIVFMSKYNHMRHTIEYI